MKSLLGFSIVFLSMFGIAQAEPISPVAARSYATLMKKALDNKDAPAACWYLGMSMGYIRALKNSGNEKAAKLKEDIQGAEGKCGGINTMDLKATFTPEEWGRLSELQKRLEIADL